MNLKTGIFSLALGSLLLGSTAFADDAHAATAAAVQTQSLRGGAEQTYAWGQNGTPQASVPVQAVAYNGRSRHTPQPPAPRNQQGRYELKRVQQFVPGKYEQVWVQQECRYIRRGNTCTAGHYEQKWVPGHYETVEQWVWVPTQGRGRWG